MRAENPASDADKSVESIQALCLSEKSTECICPKCGAHHKIKLLWTGRGKPRKFCPVCKHYACSINDTDPFVVSRSAGLVSASSM